MSDYAIVRRLLLAEQRRRDVYYRYRPFERAPAMREIADGLAALERLRRASEWAAARRWWQDKFD